MTNNIVTEYKAATEAGAIFASAITTDFMELNRYKYVDFIVTTGIGTSANTTVTIVGKHGTDGESKAVPFREKVGNTEYKNIGVGGKALSIGGTTGKCGHGYFRVTADDLAHDGFDRVALKTTAVASSTVPGAVVAVLYEPRYTK